MTYYPCLFLLNGDEEAEDVIYFCSEACIFAYNADSAEQRRTEVGRNDEWIEGTVCTECQKALTVSHD